MRRRLLGMLLAVVMAVGAISATALTAFAEDPVIEAKWGASANSLTASGTLYNGIQEAKKNASIKYIQLQNDVSVSSNYTIEGINLTIDLNGKNVTSKFGFGVGDNAVVTFIDTAETDGTFSSSSTSAIGVSGNAVVRIEGGNYVGEQFAIWTSDDSPSVTITGGTFSAEDLAIDHEHGTLTITGGTFVAGSVSGVQVREVSPINPKNPELNINGGSFEGSTVCGNVIYRGGSLTLGEDAPWWQIELYNGTADEVTLGAGKINLLGYIAVDAEGNRADKLVGNTGDPNITLYRIKPCSHSVDADATCTAKKPCSICGMNYGPHVYQANHKCSCGADESFTVKFVDWDDTRILDVQTIVYGETAAAPTGLTREGHTFNGWDIDFSNVTQDLTVKAQYVINRYTITFKDTGDVAYDPITQDYGTAVTAPADPVKAGYTFAGWDKEVPGTMPAENVTITAMWTVNQRTITFDTGDGSSIAPITQDYGTAVTAPADPVKAGYTFAGWDKEVPGTMPAENVTITAKWEINQYTITFADTGDVAYAPITQDYGTAITAPADPTKEGYTFAGWDKEIPATMPAEDVTITAKWNSNYVPAPTYPPAVEDVKGGEVSVSTPNPSAGDKVTVSAKPAIGFEIGDVTVTDKDGNQVEVTVNEDGTYSFTQPSGAVNVEVSFALAGSGCQGDDGCVISGFSDAGTGSWYHEGVCWALSSGILRGYDNGLLGPTNVTTRAQLFAMLHRLEGEPEAAAGSTFADVNAGAWYAGSIAWAQQAGLALGYGDGSEIGPNDPLTREQLATILYRYAQWKGMDVSASADLGSFADGSDLSSYAAPAVEWAVSEGVIRGYDDGSDEIGSKDSAQRGQVATMLMRFVAL